MKPMLAKTYTNQDVTGWLMSEKLDGVRAIWTGSKLMSRLGNQFYAPPSFTSQLPPDIMLDGELYIGRGLFQKTVSIVRRHVPVDAQWGDIRYCVFDAPEALGRFEARVMFYMLLDCNNALSTVKQVQCKSISHMTQFFNDLCENGAEGIILKNPASMYKQRRSSSMLKYKPKPTKSIACVVGYEPGKGKYVGMVGALICIWKGKSIKLGSGLTDTLRESPPSIGTEVKFKFQELTDVGLPRFPRFIGE